ncbi:telomere repeat-binding factor 5 [Vitis vinifera]|uniref:telomere repeat-binding factor 5 n=1 Tax=Vitis vinifera TaxID=29760 RepID=UPI00053FE881|nr:telomere repeat-binding factor 5 [Vitis vinifera]XP_059595421.1 telomere repeat-binding factor 5 [Vitis vinifera]|eukprot:XP_010654494.1 PREDICTED: telomere repeat-binding factor 5 [Vitis vinifera]
MDVDDPDGSVNEKAWYTTMIFEALSTMNNSAGCSISEIANSIEKRHMVPENFRESLNSKLTDLVSMEKLDMDQNCFKIKKVLGSSQSESHNQTLEEAAAEAARLIAEAEHKEILAAEAVEELERVERMVEESEAILKMTEDLMRNAGAGEGNP